MSVWRVLLSRSARFLEQSDHIAIDATFFTR
jgi:hypothetical protein